MTLSPAQRERCVKVMDELAKRSISRMFAQPVDPKRDEVPNYFQIVQTPMDLGTIRRKLNENQYQTVACWKSDMELVWSNSLLVNSRTSLLGNITIEMQNLYHKLSQFVSDNPETDWMSQLLSVRDELNAISKRSLRVTQPPIKKEVAPVTKSPKPQQAKQQSKNQQAKQQQQAKLPPPKTAKRVAPPQQFTKADILKLTSDINSLTDDLHIQMILEVLQKYEPQIKDDGDKLELDLAPLKTATLLALREKVDQCLTKTPGK